LPLGRPLRLLLEIARAHALGPTGGHLVLGDGEGVKGA